MRRVVVVLVVLALLVTAYVWLRPKPIAPVASNPPPSLRLRRPAAPPPVPVDPNAIHYGGLGGVVVDLQGNPAVSRVTLVRVSDLGSQSGDVAPCGSTLERRAFDVVRGRVISDVVSLVETAADGRFEFKSLAPGMYAVSADAGGMRSATFPFEVGFSREAAGVLVLKPVRTLDVSVWPRVEGASVLVFDASGVFAEVPLGESGRASIPSLAAEGLGLVAVAGGRVSWVEDMPDDGTSASLRFLSWHPLEVRVSRGGVRVSGAEVRVVGDDAASPCVLTSDSQGIALFPSLAADDLSIEATLGPASAFVGLGVGWEGEPVELALDARAPLRVVVRDPGGAPVEGAAVSIGASLRGRTDAKGELVLRSWRSGESFAVRREGFEDAYAEIPFKLDAAPRVEVELLPWLPVTCRVATPPGFDRESLQVRLEGTAQDPVLSDDGAYLFTEARRGSARCVVSSPLDLYGVSAEFEHPQGPTGSVVDVALAEAGGEVEVRVVDAEGHPKAGATLSMGPSGGWYGEVAGAVLRWRSTDAKGLATFKAVPAGDWELTLFEGDAEDPERAVLVEEVFPVGPDAKVVRELVWPALLAVDGVVRDHEGKPVEGAYVSDQLAVGRRGAHSDAEGRFSLRFPSGSTLRLTASLDRRESPPEECAPGDEVELVLPPPLVVTGRILLADGAVPQLLRIAGRSVETLDGRFSQEISEDQFRLTFAAKDVAPLEVELPEEANMRGADLGELRFPASRRLTVHAQTKEGAPLADVRVESVPKRAAESGLTDTTGVVVLDGLPDGAIKLKCLRPDRSSAVVDVPTGARDVTCVLEATGTLEVRVAANVGSSKPIKVEVDSLGAGDDQQPLGPDRRATFELPAGHYIVVASDEGHDQLTPIQGVDVNGGSRTVIELQPFQQGGVVRVGRNEAGGTPLLLIGDAPLPTSLAELFRTPERLRMEENEAYANVPAGPAQFVVCKPEEGRRGEDRARCRRVPFVARGSGEQVVDLPADAPVLVIELGDEF